jgi:RHS repeat-associated protein
MDDTCDNPSGCFSSGLILPTPVSSWRDPRARVTTNSFGQTMAPSIRARLLDHNNASRTLSSYFQIGERILRMGNRLPIALAALFISLFAADALAAVGRTVGQFAVSPMGSAQYSIPIWAPQGPNGVQPHIALTYNSQQGNGYVGVGWGVSGLSSIYRCNLTIAQDGAAAPVALAISDGYCMDGRRLRLTGGTYGTAGSTYQTEIANFVNVVAYGAAGNGPAYWQATDRNGWQYTYGGGGTTSNAEVLASASTTANSWQLNEVKDPIGNSMTITYSTSDVTGLVVPQVISWVPASAGSSSYNYTMTFSYGTNGSLYGYVGGTPFNNTNLLSSIAIAYQGTALKTYNLTYSNTTTATSRYLLTQIQECAGTGTSNCLLPTSIAWQAGSAGVGSPTALGGTVGTVVSTAFDLNGDGRNDVVMVTSTGAVLVALGGSSGYGTAVNTGLSSSAGGPLIADIDGSGVASLVVAGSDGYWHYYKGWSGSAFAETGSTGMAVASFPSAVLADVDGDGRADLAYIGSDGYVHVRLNTSTGGAVSFSSTDLDSLILINDGLYSPRNVSTRGLHFWGGAQEDVVGTYKFCSVYVKPNSPACATYAYTTYVLHFTGSTFAVEALSTTTDNPLQIVDYADYNDDGCTDILTTTQLLLSTCNGNISTFVPLPSGVTAVGGMDWNADGRRDVLVSQSNGYVGVVLSTGTGLASTVTTTSIPYSSSTGYSSVSNLTGDGQDGLLASTSTSVSYYLHAGTAGAPPDLLTQVTDGYGNSAAPTYVSIAQSNYTQYTDATYPYQNYIGPLYVVSEATFSDPSSASGATYNKTYQYYGAWTNLQGRGFQAFETIKTTDSRYVSPNSLYDYRYFETTFPWSGMQNQHLTSTGSFYPMQAVGTPNLLTQATLSSSANEQRYFPYFTNWTVYQKEVGGAENGDSITTSSTNYTYDSYGNATTVATTVTDNDPGSPAANPYVSDTWISTTVNTISPDTSTWCLGLPTQTTVTNSSTAPGGASITRTVNYTPDYTNCRETQKVTAPGTAYQVTEAYGFDSFGNINSDTVTGAGMGARTTSVNWGATGQFPTTITNPLGQSITKGYDPASGSLTSQTDPNSTTANPIVTKWSYDPFFRKVQENRPDGTYTTWTYNDCATYGGCILGSHALALSYFIYTTANAIENDGTTYFDQVDRPLMSNSMMLSGGYNRNEARYDSLGRTAQQAMPCVYSAVATPCTYWTTNTYDLLNRLTQSQRPISSTNSAPQTTIYGYAGRTATVKDALNNTTTKISLVTGALARSQDPNGYYQNFTYDAFGSLVSVTDSASPSNTLSTATYQYGLQAFKIASTDVDLGARSYTVDPLGEVTAYSDVKGQNFSMTYDALSRPLIRTEPDLTTTWTWGNSASSHNIGKLASVTAASSLGTYQEAHTFDSLTRPSNKVITIPGDQSYTYTKSYNAATGLLSSLAYPQSTSGYQLTLNYTYTNGILSALTDAGTGTVYWTANTSNARGQITEETLGDGVVTSRNFDAVTGWLGSVGAGVGTGSTALQNSAYLYDEMGNVSQRQDNNRGLTENFYYDNNYRLSYSTLNSTQNLTLTYANNGNIATRSDIGGGTAWSYDPVHMHAVTQTGTGGYSFAYDANGNATSRNGYTNTWTSYNYPSGVNSAGESASFYYGPNRQRIETIYSGSIGTETTYHVGQLLEKVANANGSGITDWRYYIKAGNELVGVYSTQVAAVHYTIGDQQGGIATITSTGGASCPAGYTLSGSTCTETLSQPATASYSCPAGYTLSGSSCVDATSMAATATYSCPAGYTLSATTCSETETAAATVSYSCPTGYSLSGTNCSETQSKAALYACGTPAIAGAVSSLAPNAIPDICKTGYYYCQAGWTLTGTTCYQTITQPATVTYSCPAGYALSGTTCSKTLTQAATVSYSCPAGYTLSGSTCSKTLTVSATVSYSCPAGYALTGTTCSETLTVAATSSGPGVLVAESFTAFGNRRSGEIWSGAPSSTDETTINGVSRWGYTGQTELGVSMGLNHMNGRVQDAITGRFLSPDPNIPNPGNTQSWNRYSYVNNNPLTQVDPTGFQNKYPSYGGTGGGNGGYYSGSFDPSTGITTVSWGGGGSSGYDPSSLCYVCGSAAPTNYLNLFNPNEFSAQSQAASNGNSPANNPSSAQSQYPDAIYSVPGPAEAAAVAGELGVGAVIRSAVSAVADFVSGLWGGNVTAYSDSTAPGASVTNFLTDATAEDADAALKGNGFTVTVSADGNATIYTTAGGGTYVIRPSNSAPGSAAMDYYPINGNDPSKINFGGPPYTPEPPPPSQPPPPPGP